MPSLRFCLIDQAVLLAGSPAIRSRKPRGGEGSTSARWPVLALHALLAGCVQTPLAPQVPYDYTHVGLPLSPSEVVSIFVSTELSPRDLREQQGQVSPAPGPALVMEGITAGFRALHSDVQIAVADEALRIACFDAGTRSAHRIWADAVVLVPDPGRVECRALVRERNIRYLVSIGGYRWTGRQEGQQWASTAYGWETPQVYALAAETIDVSSGASVCGASDHERATSSVGVAWLYLPVPVFSVVDESAYWRRVAWNVGNKLRSCFLQPDATRTGK